jgi:signal peptidase II
LAMILGGGIGNLIDRLQYGYVVDFIEFRLIKFPVFNVADISVVCGSILLILYVLLVEPKIASNKEKSYDA